MNCQRRAWIGNATQSDNALADQCDAVAADKSFLSLGTLQESPIGALINKDEISSPHFDLCMNSRNQVALDDKVIVLCATQIDALIPIVDDDCLVPETNDHF